MTPDEAKAAVAKLSVQDCKTITACAEFFAHNGQAFLDEASKKARSQP